MDLVADARRQLRRAGLAAFSRVNPGDVTITHHWTGQPLRMHSFRHKGYWFHGRRRERAEMQAMGRLIRPGDCVLDVGAHIGYITMYLASLVGPTGSVHAFEPGRNNLHYLHANTSNVLPVRVVAKAVGYRPGLLPLYAEDLTGQNNSLVRDFSGLQHNQSNAIRTAVTAYDVEVTSVDRYVADHDLRPAFVKIDVEGYELAVLAGASAVLARDRPAIMVEVQGDREAIAALLSHAGYRIYSPDGALLARIPHGTSNVFCVPEHAQRRYLWPSS